MTYKSFLLFLLGATAFLFLNVEKVNACSCAATPTVLEEYEWADTVVIVKATSIEKADKTYGYKGIRSATTVVEKVFKGNIKVDDEMVFAQGGGSDCIWTFDESSIGQEYLFYLKSSGKDEKVWIVGTCGRSHNLKYAADDLLYLNNLKKVRGKSRISGTVEFEKDTDLSVEGIKIRVVGTKKTYEVKTDENGVYEIYDLPAGKYFIEPSTPKGWKIDSFWLEYSRSFTGEKKK